MEPCKRKESQTGKHSTSSYIADVDWTINDQKAKADIILCVRPRQLTELRGCTSSRQVWLKLVNIFASKGPAGKAILKTTNTAQNERR